MTTATTIEPNQAGSNWQLYVVLHGALAIHEDRDSEWIRVFAPEMKEHSYLAGPWLGEITIPSGSTLVLKGVEPTKGVEPNGSDSLANHPSEMLLFEGGQCNPAMSYLEICLPRPKNIGTPAAVQMDADQVQVYGPKQAFSPQTSRCTVFIYDVKPGNTPSLDVIDSVTTGMNSAKCFPAGQGSGSWFSLHIFAEAPYLISDPVHAASAFRMAAGIIGIDASLTPKVHMDGNPTPNGYPLLPEETQGLLSDRHAPFSVATGGTRPSGSGQTEGKYTCANCANYR